MATIKVTEVKLIDVETECIDNAICLKWLNTSSSYSTWVFGRTNTKTIQTAADGEYNKNEPDLALAQGSAEYISKNSQPSIILGANMPKYKMDGMQGLIESPKVLMLMNNDTWATVGCVWQRVKVRIGSFVIVRETETRMDVELVILTPEKNLQSE